MTIDQETSRTDSIAWPIRIEANLFQSFRDFHFTIHDLDPSKGSYRPFRAPAIESLPPIALLDGDDNIMENEDHYVFFCSEKMLNCLVKESIFKLVDNDIELKNIYRFFLCIGKVNQ